MCGKQAGAFLSPRAYACFGDAIVARCRRGESREAALKLPLLHCTASWPQKWCKARGCWLLAELPWGRRAATWFSPAGTLGVHAYVCACVYVVLCRRVHSLRRFASVSVAPTRTRSSFSASCVLFPPSRLAQIARIDVSRRLPKRQVPELELRTFDDCEGELHKLSC